MFSGDRSTGYTLKANLTEKKKGSYYRLGLILITIVAQKGQPPQLFKRSIMNNIMGYGYDVEDVCDEDKKKNIQSVSLLIQSPGTYN